ncbi:MAG: AAA family ATPase [Acidimicrobiia bacterium]
MKIGVAGKGGSGKTTISGTLARALAERGEPLIAIDVDPNPNLGPTLGIEKAAFDAGVALPHEILDHQTVDGAQVAVLTRPLNDVLATYGMTAPAGIKLLTMGKAEKAGGG